MPTEKSGVATYRPLVTVMGEEIEALRELGGRPQWTQAPPSPQATGGGGVLRAQCSLGQQCQSTWHDPRLCPSPLLWGPSHSLMRQSAFPNGREREVCLTGQHTTLGLPSM